MVDAHRHRADLGQNPTDWRFTAETPHPHSRGTAIGDVIHVCRGARRVVLRPIHSTRLGTATSLGTFGRVVRYLGVYRRLCEAPTNRETRTREIRQTRQIANLLLYQV